MDVQISIRIVYMDEMMAVTSDKCNNILTTLVSKLKSTLDLIIKAAKTGGAILPSFHKIGKFVPSLQEEEAYDTIKLISSLEEYCDTH